jgi:riboflavin biosynthesis pyrimidine reductase
MKPDYTLLEFPAATADRPYVLVNMVMSVDGKAVFEGSERGLGSQVDWQLMRELRVHADVVMSGAGTIRATGISPRLGVPELEALRVSRGKAGKPIGAVISGSGDLPLDKLFFTARDFRAVVYLAAKAPAARRAAIVATGREVVDLPAKGDIAFMLRHMRHELGAQLLMVEGGPGLNAQLFAHGFVDEYYATVGPVVVAGRDTLTPVEGAEPFTRAAAPKMRLLSAVTNEETDEVYLRYRVVRS